MPSARPTIILLLLACICRIAGGADAAPRPLLNPLFSDHMVLQRDAKLPVWGWTDPGAVVTVQMAGVTVQGTADASGRWSATIGPFAAGGPFELTAVGPVTVTVGDVLVGDVWICSGQSNMAMGIGLVNDAAAEIAKADAPRIRLFTVGNHIATAPVDTPGGRWQPCTPASVAAEGWGGFSAVGYFFGRDVHAATGVPVGLIHSSWGGTPAEAWVSEQALRTMPDFRRPLDDLVAARSAAAAGDPEKRMDEWWQANDPGSKAAAWAAPAFDASAWKSMELPGAWEQRGLPDFDGIVWFRKQIDVPAGWAGKDLVLDLGPIDDRDVTWFNGVQVGAKNVWNEPRSYPVPGSAVKAGANTIAVRVLDTGGGGGLYGAPGQLQLRLAAKDAAAAALPLAGPWLYREAAPLTKLPGLPQRFDDNPNAPSVLFDGMIAPLVPFAIKGVIWYQGESNAWRAQQYRTLLPTLIADWRARFACGDVPFLIVQLANFTDVKPEPGESQWAELREAQAHTAANVPRTGLAVAIDIGDAKDIHPKDKQTVGHRLALAALAITYGARNAEWSGPAYRTMTVKDHAARIAFDHLAGGLAAKGAKLEGFAIAGADGAFVWADAVIDGGEVVVSSPQVPEPTRVRYAWADNPVCNLYGGTGLPAVPFRTDEPKE